MKVPFLSETTKVNSLRFEKICTPNLVFSVRVIFVQHFLHHIRFFIKQIFRHFPTTLLLLVCTLGTTCLHELRNVFYKYFNRIQDWGSYHKLRTNLLDSCINWRWNQFARNQWKILLLISSASGVHPLPSKKQLKWFCIRRSLVMMASISILSNLEVSNTSPPEIEDMQTATKTTRNFIMSTFQISESYWFKKCQSSIYNVRNDLADVNCNYFRIREFFSLLGLNLHLVLCGNIMIMMPLFFYDIY